MIKQKERPLLLDSIFGQRSKLAALRCLTLDPSGMSGRELGRRAALSHQTVIQTLNDLVSSGIVLKESIPPAYRFSLNHKHWMVKDIIMPTFAKELGWVDTLIEELARKLPNSVRSLILYGSLARGEMKAESDIDLIALTGGTKNDAEAFFAAKSLSLSSVYKHKIAVMVYKEEEFKNLYRQGNRFAREVVNTGRVVRGKLLTEILFGDGPKTH